MDTIITGEGSADLRDVTRIIEKSTSFGQLSKKWRLFGEELGLRDEVLEDLRLRLNQEIYELSDLPRKILKIWKASQGTNATLQMLCNALEDCRVRDIADALTSEFAGNCETQLDIKLKFELQKKIYTWGQLVGKDASDELCQLVKEKFGLSSDTPISLIREQFSPQDQPEYYISRTFLFQSELNEKIFNDKATKDHIFVVKGASKSEVARVCGLQMIECSRNQLNEITVRFILLECDEDFEKILTKASNPVHKIEYKNGRFFWILSTESVEVIQKFFIGEFKRFDEDVLISRITSHRPTFALSIADSPGMGKTFILANLAKKIEQMQPNAVVLFIVLQEFVKQSHFPGRSFAVNTILSYVSENHTKKSILQEILKNNTFQFFLLFDGYDEVLQDKLHLVDSFLKDLANYKNVRVIITTRRHLEARLECILNSFSFRIHPFHSSNQIDFLTKYWTTKHGAKKGTCLKEFAARCLDKLQKVMTDNERNIAGIPLQCMMLAEIYADDAVRASKQERLLEDAVKELSFFQMYKALIELKFSKVPDPWARQKYMDVHIYASIILLFPKWLEKFKSHLSPRNYIDGNTLFSIGLLEKIPFLDGSRFVHRTFAECLFADFIAGSLRRSTIFVDFLYKEILAEVGVTLERKTRLKEDVPVQPSLFNLKYPAIAYFLNMSLQERYRNADLPDFLITLDLQNITEEDVCSAANACCCNDLESCFDFTTSIITQCLSINDKVELKDKYFKHLIHLVIKNTNNDSFVRNVIRFTKSKLGINLGYHVFEGVYEFESNLEIAKCTPLHVAIYWGKYNIAMHLLQEYGEDVLAIKHLLHVCVYNSYKNSETVIENKLSIIEALVQLKKEWLEEEFEERTPLLQYRVHVKIVKRLVDRGANINAHSTKYGTVLHTIQAEWDKNSESSVSNLVRWAFNNGFELVHHTSAKGLTLLMKTIQRYNKVDDETLRMLNKASVDFNAQDENGDSVLFYAIRYSESLKFIQKILDYGANLHHINREGRNAAHIVMSADNDLVVLEKLNLLKSRGFNGWDQTDNCGCTPLMLGIENEIIEDNELLQFFHEQGVDFNAHDNGGDSVLLIAVENSNDIDIIQKLLDYGANPNHRNMIGQSVADIVIDDYEYDPTEMLKLVQLFVSNGFDGVTQSILSTGDISQITSACREKQTLFFKSVSKTIDQNGDTILFHAIRYFHSSELVSNVLEQGVEINHQNCLGENAAHYVMKYLMRKGLKQTLTLLKLLKAWGFTGLDQKDNEGRTPLMIGLAQELFTVNNWDEFLKFFFKEKVDFNAEDNHGHSVLFYAIQFSKNVDFIRKILNFGANPNHVDALGENAAHLVMRCYQNDPNLVVEVLKLLKSRGFHGLNQKNHNGEYPFMKAIVCRGILEDEVFQYLSEEGVTLDFNAQDNDGDSVLFYALDFRFRAANLSIIQKLLDFGANLNHRNFEGQNAGHFVFLHCNKYNCYGEVVLDNEEKQEVEDPKAILEILKLLESNGFEGFNEKDSNGDTPLTLAISKNITDDELLNFLRERTLE